MGIIDAEEVCDGGVNNSDTDANVCRTSCVLPTCGDGVVDTGEKCDAGNGNSDEVPVYAQTIVSLILIYRLVFLIRVLFMRVNYLVLEIIFMDSLEMEQMMIRIFLPM